MRLALVGDTMLGRGVADALRRAAPASLVEPGLADVMRSADLTIVNLECCISDRGAPIPLPGKPFFFRAPPGAVDLLAHLGVDCVTLANNHALDFGEVALLDTFEHLAAVRIEWVGAGWDVVRARAPVHLAAAGEVLSVVGFTDHPALFAAESNRPGVAHAALRSGADPWLTDVVGAASEGPVLVTPHWGPNMATEPLPRIRSAAGQLLGAGATLVAGHSAHVPQGVEDTVLYDLGDFLDDYRVDPVLRNDLGLLFLVDLEAGRPRRLEAVPLKLDFCRTGFARGDDAAWIGHRFRAACAAFGREVTTTADGHLELLWSSP
jgi:poly-gamma-glutamate capsule biosynthesis protein CapA/YwtB (metallophosphatase superfamily)